MKNKWLVILFLCVGFGVNTVQAAISGEVVAWGKHYNYGDYYGETTVPVAARSGVMAIAAGDSHTVALKNDGSVVVWGNNGSGQSTVPVAAQSGVMAIAAGGSHTVALKNDGSVVVWGHNGSGQSTVPVAAQSGVMAIAAGGSHTVALKNDGSVVVWGNNGSGQSTVPVAAQSGMMAIAAGGSHTVALKNDGRVVAWGYNYFGQTTVPVAAQSGVMAIAAGGSHNVALKNDGSVVAWGYNGSGQTTVPVVAQSGVAAIAAGGSHTVALKNDGGVVAWGYNNYGQTTVPLTAQNGVTAIAAGSSHTVALVISAAPVIITPPVSQTVNVEQSVSFTVTATGYPSYQWRKDGTDLNGATNASYTLSNVQTNQAGSYTVVVSNFLGSVTSAPPAVLTVNVAAPSGSIHVSFGTSPSMVGGQIMLCASLSGAPFPAVQWQFNGTNLPGETSSCLYLGNLQTNQSGGYTFIASNALGVVTSAVAVITVVEPTPVLAFFANSLPPLLVGSFQYLCAVSFLPEPATFQWRFNGTNLVEATNECFYFPAPLQPEHAGDYSVVATTATSGVHTSPPIALTIYFAPPSSASPYSNLGSSSAMVGEDVSLFAAYSGSPSFVQWRFNGVNLPGQTNAWLVMLAVTTNQAGEYSFTATNMAGATTSSVQTVSVSYQPPVFLVQPTNQSSVVGTKTRLQAYARGGPPPDYLLQFNGTNVAVPFTYEGYGAASGGFSLLDTTFADAGSYRVIASNSLGSVTSLVATLAVTASGPLDQWTQRNPRPQSQPIFAAAHGPNQFVAVGDRGTILTSPDGSNWALQNRRADVPLYGVAYGGGLFVAVGGEGTILTSSDGTNWAYRYTYGAMTLNDVTHAAGRFVAVGSAPGLSTLIMLSADGLNWERIPLEGFNAQQCIAYGNGQFIAASFMSIIRSADGTNWALAQAVPKQVESVTYANGQFVAVGDDGSIQASVDGVSWAARTSPTTRRLTGVTYGEGRFVAAGARGTMLTSTDAITWVPAVSGTLDRLETIDFSDGLFIAAGENGTIITSTNGTSWTKQNFGPTRDLDGMYVANGTLVVVGKGGSIITSTNGAQYATQDAGVTNDLHGATWGGGLWVAVGEPGIVLTSSNAVHWTSRDTGTTNSLKDATYANGQWIVVGTQGTVVRSTDGVNWTATLVPPNLDLNDVAYGNGVFLVAGDGFGGRNGFLLRSVDGVTWAGTGLGSVGKNLRGIVFTNGVFLITANDGLVLLTTNGVNFSQTYPSGNLYGRNLRAATWAHGLWIVVGNNGFISTSPDLVTWTQRASRTFENFHQVVEFGGRLVVIGNRGTVLQSGRLLTEWEPPSFITGNGFQLSFKGVLYRRYEIQATTNLLQWDTLTSFTNLTERTNFTDSGALDLQRRFYRLVEP